MLPTLAGLAFDELALTKYPFTLLSREESLEVVDFADAVERAVKSGRLDPADKHPSRVPRPFGEVGTPRAEIWATTCGANAPYLLPARVKTRAGEQVVYVSDWRVAAELNARWALRRAF